MLSTLQQFCCIGVTIVSCLLSPSSLAGTVVIVDKDSDINQLSQEEIRDIFLGKINTFPNGKLAVPLDLSQDSEARQTFLNKIVQRNESQLRAYWSRLIFTGRGKPPKTVDDEYELVMRVADDPNLIGYVSTDAIDDSVKVVYRLD